MILDSIETLWLQSNLHPLATAQEMEVQDAMKHLRFVAQLNLGEAEHLFDHQDIAKSTVEWHRIWHHSLASCSGAGSCKSRHLCWRLSVEKYVILSAVPILTKHRVRC